MRQPIKRNLWKGMTALLASLLLAGCAQEEGYQETSFYAMDTVMRFQILAPQDSGMGDRMREEADQASQLLSAVDPESELYRLNHREEESFEASPELAEVLSRCLQLCRETGGALNIALYPVTQAWGFTSKDYHVPDPATLADAMGKIQWEAIGMEGNLVTLPAQMELDLGSVGKGWLTNRCVDILEENQVKSALLDLGGNIYALGRKEDGNSWRIGIQDPFGEGIVCSFPAEDEAVVTSGTYQRYFEKDGKRYHHILDSETGYPVENGLESVTVILKDAFVADALSTACFVMGLEDSAAFRREHYPEAAMVWVTSQGQVYYTENLENRIQLADGVEGHLVE